MVNNTILVFVNENKQVAGIVKMYRLCQYMAGFHNNTLNQLVINSTLM